jgi:heat-inducible transcriptional repressor
MALDDRKASILRALVEEYIQTGQPVGSGHLAKLRSVSVSSATVRNDMAHLEAEGYLDQPHTSAGRIPTEKGYRFFVDHLDRSSGLASPQAAQVRSFFERTHGELEQTLQQTSHLLSELTQYTAVVVGPDTEAATVLSVQLVALSPRVALMVVVSSNGAVDKFTVELGQDTTDDEVEDARRVLVKALVGQRHGDFPKAPKVDDRSVMHVVTKALGALRGSGSAEQVFVDGASRVVSAFDAIETVSEVLTILEQQLIVVTLLRDLLDRGLEVAIGSETGVAPLADCSIVVAPYEVEGEQAGTIGVLGPTRMDYPQALAAVAVVSKRLGRRLSEGDQRR